MVVKLNFFFLIEMCPDISSRCPAIPEVTNVTVYIAGSLDGGVTTLKCVRGHRFPDGRTVRQLLCNNGQWNESHVPPCSRRFLVFTL